MENEIWKDIPGYEGIYKISNYGRVESLPRRNCIGNKVPGKILKPGIDSDGYYFVVLSKDCSKKHITIHKLVANNFIANPQNKPEIDHINTNRKDNRIENLRWVTRKENANNSKTILNYKAKKHIYKALEFRCKPVIQLKNGIIICEYISAREAERKTGISHQNIHAAIIGRSRFAGGYEWKYKNH